MPLKPVTTRDLAEVFGVTIARISQLRKDGVLSGEGSPLKYDLPASVQAYVSWAVDSAKARKPEDVDAERKKLQAEADYKEAKARQEELKLAELEGRMHSAEDVEAATTQLVYSVRSMLLALPGRVAVDAAGKSASEVSEVVRREAFTILEGLSEYEYDPKVYAQMVREREGWHADDEDGGAEA